ncbi:MAG: sulfatase-like hydrolase/transferase [Planctomycetota bacterium]|jgi:hypothetical protein
MSRPTHVLLVTLAAGLTSPPVSAAGQGGAAAPGTSGSGVVTPAPNQPPFEGVIGPTVEQSQPHWPDMPRAPEGAPNILFIVLDDVGFAQLGCYGAPIETPHIDRLARGGLSYNNFHATPLCSPTRAAILTGRNHHSCALGIISEFSTGFPGYTGRMPLSHGMISEMLAPAGWSTFALGKWHLTPPEDVNLAANRRWWPLGRGFDRYYGFLGGTTSRYVPWLTHDNHFVRPPKTPEQGYHLLTDMVEKASEFVIDVKHVDPRCEARRSASPVLHVLLPRWNAGAATRARGLDREVRRRLRRRLGSLPRGGAPQADRARYLPARHEALAS